MNHPSLILAFAMLAGVIAQAIARQLRLPGIVFLLAMGVVLGPDVAGLVVPDSLGGALLSTVGFGVAVILFEGGLNQDIARLRGEAVSIRRLVILGPLVTTAVGAVAAHSLLGWNWRLSLLFGTLVIVTGPTVVTPLLRRLRVRRPLSTILEAEGVFIDAIGALVAFAALELVLQPTAGSASTAAIDLATRFGVGMAGGAATGGALVVLLGKRQWLPDSLRNVFTLALVIATFEACDFVASESGLVASIVAGMIVGNSGLGAHELEELASFKEQLTDLLLAVLFVLLAADVRVADVAALGWFGILVVAALVFIARPLLVFLCTVGSGLSLREKLFVSWISPRGIVAAAVASLFAEKLDAAGVPGGTELRALVFLTIVLTVVVQGLSASPLANLLGLERPPPSGTVIVGANPHARSIGRPLADNGEEIVFVDTSEANVLAARREGLEAVRGDVLMAGLLDRLELERRRRVVALTTSSKVNYLALQRMQRRVPTLELYVDRERHADDTVGPHMFEELDACSLDVLRAHANGVDSTGGSRG